MASKQKPASKVKAKNQKRAPKQTAASTAPSAPVVYKIRGDTQNMLKLEWSADHGDVVGSPVSMKEAVDIAAKNKAPFCKNTLSDPTKKYYCEFSTQDNEWICDLVDADDPRCRP
jgi:hypothetical protein